MNEHFIYWVNGLLLMLYALWRVKFAVVGLIIALVILARFGGQQAETAGQRSLRYGRGNVSTLTPSFWLTRLLAIGVWTLGALLAPTDIEGAWSVLLWLALFVTLAAIPAERGAVLFRHVWLMAFYGCGMVALRILIGTNVTLGHAMNLLHVTGDSRVLFDAVRNSLMPGAGALMWAVFPIGNLYLMFQRFQVMRGPLGAQGRPQNVMTGLSHRGEDRRSSPRESLDRARQSDWHSGRAENAPTGTVGHDEREGW